MLATLPPRSKNEDFDAQNQAAMWCVVHVREPLPRPWMIPEPNGVRETNLAERLSDKGIECYLPMLSVRRVHHGRAETVRRPLYPYYLFAAFSNQNERRRIRQTYGVEAVLDQPQHTQDELAQQIAAIRRVLAEDPTADSAPWAKGGVKVVVTSGAFQGIRGEIIKRRRKVKGETIVIDLLHVGVTLLGRILEIEIDPTLCEPI